MLQTTTTASKPRVYRESTLKFYDTVRQEYHRLLGKKRFGCQFYSDEQIFATLANKYFKSSKTIENIVYYRV